MRITVISCYYYLAVDIKENHPHTAEMAKAKSKSKKKGKSIKSN